MKCYKPYFSGSSTRSVKNIPFLQIFVTILIIMTIWENERMIGEAATKWYLPTNERLIDLLKKI